MKTFVAGIFTDSDQAGEAVAELKELGYTNEISVITRDYDDDVESEQVKEDVGDGTMQGAGVGALLGLIAGVVAVALPGAPLLVAGPIAATWGLSGAALGALSGGLVGALVDLGFDEAKAKAYEEQILAGEIMVAVTADEEHLDDIMAILESYGVTFLTQVEGGK